MSLKMYGAVLLAIITYFAAADALADDGRLLSVRIVGSVFCDTCYKQHFSKQSYFVSGASVAVECRNNTQTPDFWTEAKTNDYGQFKVELPPSIFHSDKQLKRCSVKLLQNEEQKGPCKLVSIANSSSFTLKSKKGSIHTYSAGIFSYKPQSPPPFCSQDAANDPKSDLKAAFQSSKASGLPLFPQIPNPFEGRSLVELPPLPPLPPVELPPLPPLPPVELPPLVPLPTLPPVELPPLVPLPTLPPVELPPLTPPAQQSPNP